jgi:hypothetical protein
MQDSENLKAAMSYSERVKCQSCDGSGSRGEHGCTDCLGKGLDHAAFVGGIEEALNDAYAEGRKDEREALTLAMADLHNAILNLPCEAPRDFSEEESLLYTIGCRDARHDAAELVRSQAAKPVPREDERSSNAPTVPANDRPTADWRKRAMQAEDAYLNMRAWAEKNGVDTAAYGPSGAPMSAAVTPTFQAERVATGWVPIGPQGQADIVAIVWNDEDCHDLVEDWKWEPVSLVASHKADQVSAFGVCTVQAALPSPRDWVAELLRLWNEAYPRMDIYAAPGSLVMFDGRGGYDGEQKHARATLRMRGIYRIKDIRISSSSSTVELEGVTGRFNTVLFSAPPVHATTE